MGASLIPIKVNGITNLQDARFCSALGIQWLTFDIAPGSLYKLPEKSVLDMIQWLDGPQLVFNLGEMPFKAFESSSLYPLAQILQIDEQMITNKFGWPSEQTIVTFVLEGFEDVNLTRLHSIASQSLFVELMVDYADIDSLIELLNPILSTIPNIVLNIDSIPAEVLQQLKPFPMAIAARKCIDEGLMQLNYDAVESMLLEFATRAGYEPPTHLG